jgi:outer membrane protein OmpA-like peptidoglycan-associated protein/ABC-type nitrate/sulfonate/bicarbonate transport system substrate-binding protein
MKAHTIILIIIIVVSITGITVLKLLSPGLEESRALETSDAKDIKGNVRIALDSWIGYYFLRSPVFRKLMRECKYNVEIIDDNANYALRMKRLRSGEIDMAVATVDSYLINAAPEGFPATIIALIDESKGGDAIVAWESKINTLEELKNNTNSKIAFTPDSPSEYLLKSIGVHFNISSLLDKEGAWRIETNGAEDAYNKLIAKEADVAVIWEPHVTDALSKEGIIKLLGSEDTEKLIVDILLVNRAYAENNPEIVALLLSNYFKTMLIYSDDKAKLKTDIIKETKTSEQNVDAMLQGVAWINLVGNAKWFGVLEDSAYQEEELVQTIDSTVEILIENGDFADNPLPKSDAAAIINSQFITQLYNADITGTGDLDIQYTDSLQKEFDPLTDQAWQQLKQIGTLKLRPITFMSGTAELSSQGELQIDMIVENIKHYPNFRILVKGHSGLRGDKEQNLILSQQRARTVANYIITRYNVDKDRVLAVGVGGEEPLQRKNDESSRAYNDRLKRVEVLLVTENL